MNNFNILGLNKISGPSYFHKRMPTHRKKIFDEFLKFKEDDAKVTSLNLAPPDMCTTNGSYYILSWNEPHDFNQMRHGRDDRTDAQPLFE